MFNVQVTSTTMKLLPLLCLCLLTRSGITSADEHGPTFIKVEQDGDVLLPCSLSTKENIQSKLFDWKKAPQKDGRQKEVFLYDAGTHYNNGRTGQSEEFKGRVSHFQDELKHGNASIIIRHAKMSDSGNYTCVFPRLQPESKIFRVELVVGAAPEPYTKILQQTMDWTLLQCEVRGAFPKPKVEWQDSAGNILHAKEPQVSERGGGYDIILQTTVTKTDHYRCVVTQETISHQIYAETYVLTYGAASEPTITTLEQTKGWSRLQCVIRGAFPKPEVEWQDSAGNILPAEEPQVSERGGSYDIILQTTVTKTDHYRCVVTQETISHRTEAKIHEYIGGAASEPTITLLEQTKDWSRLQCEVQGASPKPKVEWQNSAGNILPAKEPQVSERGGGYDIILQTTVTKTDHYRCVVTQETINHQTEAKIHIYVDESFTGWVGIVVGVLCTILVGGVLLAAKSCFPLERSKGSSSETTDPLNA